MKQREYHGDSASREYEIWKSMNGRCYVKSDTNYHRYGGRGIQVCERWRNSFIAFLADTGRRPTSKHQLERRDNDGDYEPGNCCWATKREQVRNTRQNTFITVGSITRCIAEWAEVTGVPAKTISTRLLRNWPVEKLFIKAPSAGRWTGKGINFHSVEA